jgi:hypothetical protein
VRDAARLRSLLLLEVVDPEVMENFSEFLLKEAASPRGAEWVQVLKERPLPGLTAALAAGCFSPLLTGAEVTLAVAPWAKAGEKDAMIQKVAVLNLIRQAQPQRAREVALLGDGRSLADTPVMVEVLAALEDRHGMDDLFARLVRMSYPGGGDVQAFAEAFARRDRPELASELYALACERLRATANSLPKLVESYARFLITQHRYEEAETLLVNEHQGMTEGLPQLLLDLYRSWNKLDRLPAELAKFHLPDGLISEVLFLHKSLSPPAS